MFQMLDVLRRQRGALLDAAGFGPRETPYRIIAEQPGMRLRAYQGPAGEGAQQGPPVLLVPAPLKRSYIWDLRPEASVVRRCLESGLQVFLLEWRDPSPGEDFGLAHYAEAFPLAAAEAISAAGAPRPLTLAGHSLGGTFAAIFAALHPERVEDLWLIDAPLVFAVEAGDRLAAALRWIDPYWLAAAAGGGPVAGSLIGALATAALPEEFLFHPWADLLASSWDADRSSLHAQVLRWTLDEFPLPMRLFAEIVELYRDDRLRKGSLTVGSNEVGLADLRIPIAAVLNPASAVVPAGPAAEGLRLTRARFVRMISYQPDVGCAIQHIGPLVSPRAHEQIWPELAQRPWSPPDHRI